MQDRTALMTGSVQEIGLAIAEALAGAGVRIGLHGLAESPRVGEAEAEFKAVGVPETRFFHARQPQSAASTR